MGADTVSQINMRQSLGVLWRREKKVYRSQRDERQYENMAHRIS